MAGSFAFAFPVYLSHCRFGKNKPTMQHKSNTGNYLNLA